MSSDDSAGRAGEMLAFIQDHRRRILASGGADGHIVDTSVVGTARFSPTLVLKTTGRKSGEAQIAPLTYGLYGREWVVIASKGGAPTHPAWYLNLVADPNVTVQVKGDRYAAVARTAEGAERERLWKLMNAVWPSYDEYATRTSRVIPVVVVTRAPR